MKSLSLYLLVLSLLTLGGCSTLPEAGLAYDQADHWWNQMLRGKSDRKVVVDLSEQKAFLYSNGMLIGESPVSSGKPGYETPTGRYKVIQKSRDHRSNLYGNYVVNGRVVAAGVDNRKDPQPPGAEFAGARMPYFMRYHGAYGLHEGYLPGYPASSGCVRMPLRRARRFYHAVSLGTPVIVTR